MVAKRRVGKKTTAHCLQYRSFGTEGQGEGICGMDGDAVAVVGMNDEFDSTGDDDALGTGIHEGDR